MINPPDNRPRLPGRPAFELMALGLMTLVWLGVCIGGCHQMVKHRDANAPGHTDIDRPPAYPAAHASSANAPSPPPPERPGDPGERMYIISPGIFGAMGGRFSRPEGEVFTGMFGVELSLNHGTNPRSHNADAFVVYPRKGRGVSLGWSLLQVSGSGTTLGPVYAEVHEFRLAGGGALGYAINPSTRDHGPQASAWFTTYFVRMRYLWSEGFSAFIGAQLKLPMIWTESL